MPYHMTLQVLQLNYIQHWKEFSTDPGISIQAFELESSANVKTQISWNAFIWKIYKLDSRSVLQCIPQQNHQLVSDQTLYHPENQNVSQ